MRAKSHGSHLLGNVEYWKTRAKEARVIAQRIPHAESRETMLRIANDYERMAELAEERLRTSGDTRVG
jgi:hypothetical protein